jgi:Fe-S oxidoreductase
MAAAALAVDPALTVDGTERCCGAVALDLGLAPEAAALAAECAASLPDTDVVVGSPGCARMMREEWPRLGLAAPRVVTAPEWLAAVVGTLPVEPAGTPVAWHAPCVLARGLGVVEEPLAVLRGLGYEVREPAATGADTRCSGAGAAYPLVDPGGAETVAAQRLAELAALDAPVVTACPSAAKALGGTDLLVLAASRVRR